jgi:hypothetical protein
MGLEPRGLPRIASVLAKVLQNGQTKSPTAHTAFATRKRYLLVQHEPLMVNVGLIPARFCTIWRLPSQLQTGMISCNPPAFGSKALKPAISKRRGPWGSSIRVALANPNRLKDPKEGASVRSVGSPIVDLLETITPNIKTEAGKLGQTRFKDRRKVRYGIAHGELGSARQS